MSVIVVAQDGNPLHTGPAGPFLVLCLVLSYISCIHASLFLQGREVPLCFSCGVNVFIVTILSENGFVLLEIDFVCLTPDSLSTDQYLVEKCTCSHFIIK